MYLWNHGQNISSWCISEDILYELHELWLNVDDNNPKTIITMVFCNQCFSISIYLSMDMWNHCQNISLKYISEDILNELQEL
jgi:hypothetical protein